MENDFDFYIIKATGKINDLKKSGIKRENIRKEFSHIKTYGKGFNAKQYRVYVNTVNLWSSDFFIVKNYELCSIEAEALLKKLKHENPNVNYFLKYHTGN